MWTIPEVYTTIPKINFEDYRWYVLTSMALNKIQYIYYYLKDSCEDNILWIPKYTQYKRIENNHGNQLVIIDKMLYVNYAFVGLVPGVTEYKEVNAYLKASNLGELLSGPVFPSEMKQVLLEVQKRVTKHEKPIYKVGDIVSITTGAFFGLKGKVLSCNKQKIKLEVAMGDRSIHIDTLITDITCLPKDKVE